MNATHFPRLNVGWTAMICAALTTAAIAQESSETPAPADNRHINIHIIGFDTDEATQRQLEAMAQAGNGQAYSAENEAELSAALGQAAGVALTPVLSNENEGNSSRGQSNCVSPTGAVGATIDPKGDEDWYMIEVDRPGLLHIDITNVAPELDIVTRVYNAEGSAISGWIKPLRAGAETSGVVDIPAAGKYHVHLEDSGNDASSSQPYSLELRFEPGDAFEPNGSFGQATEIQPDAEFFTSLLPHGDRDWFTFEVPRRGALHVEITNVPQNIEAVFRVYNANVSAITGWVAPLRAGAENIADIDLPTAGRYYLHLEESNNDECNPAELQVKLRYLPGDTYEANESLGDATEIDATTQLFASILPKGDHDHYVFEVDHPGAVNISVTNVPANQDLTFRVYNRERSAITGWVAPLRAGADTEGVADLRTAGHYYIELVDNKGDERSAEQYTLSLEYMRADDYEHNNTYGTAADIGASAQGSILPKGDHDWYAFEAAGQGEYELAITNVPMEVDLHARVYNAEGSAISGWIAPLRQGAETHGTFKVKDAGRYLVEVVDGKDDARSPEMYTLTISPAGGAPAAP